jgi:hypothetical protein
VADAPPRILVGDVDELPDRVLAVADDARRDALGDGRDLAADDETPIVVAGYVALDDEIAVAALGQGAMERMPHRVLAPKVEVDAAAMVAVERLDDAREADSPGCVDGGVLGCDDRAARNRQAGRIEESVREALVRRDVDGDARGPARHRRPDPLLMDTEAQLDERVAVEADVRDVAAGGLVEDRLGARAESLALGEADQPLQLGHEVDGDRGIARRDQLVDERDGDLAGLDADALLAVLEDDVVAAVLAGAAGLAVTNVGASEVL